jgi:hypothetical protein
MHLCLYGMQHAWAQWTPEAMRMSLPQVAVLPSSLPIPP